MPAHRGEVKGMEIIADRSQLEIRGTLDKHWSEAPGAQLCNYCEICLKRLGHGIGKYSRLFSREQDVTRAGDGEERRA